MSSKTAKGASPSTMKKDDARTQVADALVERLLEARPAIEVAYERALGKLAIRFSLLHFFLERFGWVGWGVQEHIGKILTSNLPITHLVEKLRDSAETILSREDDQKELRSLLNRVEKVAQKRNELLHSIWLITDGQPVSCMSRKRGVLAHGDVPSVDDINEATLSIIRLIGEFLEFRDSALYKAPGLLCLGMTPVSAPVSTPHPIAADQ